MLGTCHWPALCSAICFRSVPCCVCTDALCLSSCCVDCIFALQIHKEMQRRYAMAEGYLSASSPDERAASLSAALQRLKATSEWLDRERFMRPRVMRSWGHVVRWHGTDAAGRPVLLIRLLRACEASSAEDNLVMRLLSSQVRSASAGLRQQLGVLCIRWLGP